MNLPPLKLKKDRERRLRAGHCWIYSNEVDTAATPLKAFSPGQPADFLDHRGRWLGSGYVNPNSLICGRLVSRDRDHQLDQSLLVHRFQIALSLRQRLFKAPFYRLVFGESDGLPGLVVDRYGETLVVQINTAGMEQVREQILAALHKVLRPTAVLLRNDTPARETEGLAGEVEQVSGRPVDELQVPEGGLVFTVSAAAGQKTGWFFDQADNRRRMLPYAQGARVLDVCSYVGAWGVQAAASGAQRVVCVDSSAAALASVQRNAVSNGLGAVVESRRGDAFSLMRELRAEGEQFDLVLVDPPAFIKRRKDVREGTLAYRRLNQMAMQLMSRDAMLITSSCSHHMSTQSLLQVVQQAGRHLQRNLQLLEWGGQSPDHPVHPAIPETAYLKAFFLRVLPAF